MDKNKLTTEHRLTLRTEIVRTATSEFMAKGVCAVRMDDIARALKISKRTLYEIYTNKEELLLEVVKVQDDNYAKRMQNFFDDPAHNVIDVIIESYNIQISWWVKSNIEFFADLKKFRKVKDFFSQKEAVHRRDSVKFFKRGVEEGLFLPNIDYSIFAQVSNASIEYVKKNRLCAEYGLEYVLRNIMLLYIRGICTSRGIAQLDAMFNTGR